MLGLLEDCLLAMLRIVTILVLGMTIVCLFGLGGVFLVQTEFPCVVLWRPEALDCRVLIPPEALELAYP